MTVRSARTLATLPADRNPSGSSEYSPGSGSADARVDLKLLQARAQRAMAARGTEAARDRLAALDAPDLIAGTVQDGVARGLMVALEEAIDLCTPAPEAWTAEPHPEDQEFAGPQLTRRRGHDLLVASAGPRIRFSRKGGVLFVDRSADLNEPDFLQFEDQEDTGCLDGFEPAPGQRPRLFRPAFLKPVRHLRARSHHLLRLEGRLGRGRKGFGAALEFEGRPDESFLRLRVAIDNRHENHRLRARFLGVLPEQVEHLISTPVQLIRTPARRFVAATLVRACGRLRVNGDTFVDVPGAQCLDWIHHEFRLHSRSS